LILMDVHMPVMDGLEATRIIKADPHGKETMIVTLTASALDDERRAAARVGADAFLTKPCREHELFAKMRTLLDITYDYEEINGAKSQPAAGEVRLGPLPRDLVEEIRIAILTGNKNLLDRLIAKVRATGDATSARALQELADRYEYDALMRLLGAEQ
jgi:CheY-like chemotaxis protein